MTTYGYEKTILPSAGGRLSQIDRPRLLKREARPKHNGFHIRPDRALTGWQIVNPVEKRPLLALASLVAQRAEQTAAREREAAVASAQQHTHRTPEQEEESRLFEEQSELLASLQWEDPNRLFDSVDVRQPRP